MLPETKEELEKAGYVFDNEAHCKGCGAEIEWWITPNGKKMPMSVQEQRVGEGYFRSVIGFRRIPHWSNCPNAKEFRNAKSR